MAWSSHASEQDLVHREVYHDVLVFESETYRNDLVLNGTIQCTEYDELSYVRHPVEE